MILWTFRIFFTGAFLYALKDAAASGAEPVGTVDLMPAYHTAVVVVLGLAAGLTWAPMLGEMVSAPLTLTFTNGHVVKESRWLLHWISRLENRRRRRMVVFLCFLEGLNRPWAPTAIFRGLNNAKPGSWVERVFARETLRFDNAQQVLKAYEVLKRHGVRPNMDHKPEARVLIQSQERRQSPPPTKLKVEKAAPNPMNRDPRIQLFNSSKPEN